MEKREISNTNNYSTYDYNCQVSKIMQKLAIKKAANKQVLKYCISSSQRQKELKISNCASHIGITNIDGIAKIVQADFCRERICNVCAWRRQAKFLVSTQPVLDICSGRGYQFIFITLTVRNATYEELKQSMDNMFHGLKNFYNNRKIKKAFKGYIRSVEMTYNNYDNTYHPHIHILAAVDSDYFTDDEKYISQESLSEIWKQSARLDYNPIVDIRKVDSTEKAGLETLKYSLKPSSYIEAISAFDKILKGRRLISFCGIIAKIRKDLKLNDDDNMLDIDKKEKIISYDLYKFDVNGGYYKFTEHFNL